MIEIPTLPPLAPVKPPTRRKLESARSFLRTSRMVYRYQLEPLMDLVGAADAVEEAVKQLDRMSGTLGRDTAAVTATCNIIRSVPAMMQLGGGSTRAATAYARELLEAALVVLSHETAKQQRRAEKMKPRKGGKP